MRLRVVKAILVGCATSLLASPLLAVGAKAADYPTRKSGMWAITMDMGHGQTMKVGMCIDSKTDRDIAGMGTADMEKMCSKRDIQHSGSTMTIDSVCKMGPSEITSHVVMNFSGDGAYTTDITAHSNPPMHGDTGESHIVQEGRWTGPCGADMKPGDMIMNGHKMHMPTGAGAHRSAPE